MNEHDRMREALRRIAEVARQPVQGPRPLVASLRTAIYEIASGALDVMTCPKCRHIFPKRLGRHGCPNCYGEGLR